MWERKKQYTYVAIPMFTSTTEGLFRKTCTAYLQFKGKRANRQILVPEDIGQPVRCIYVDDIDCTINFVKQSAKDFEKYPDATIDSDVFLRLWRLHRGKENGHGVQQYTTRGSRASRKDAMRLQQTLSLNNQPSQGLGDSRMELYTQTQRTVSSGELLRYGRKQALGQNDSSGTDIEADSEFSCASSTTSTLSSGTIASHLESAINTPMTMLTPVINRQTSRGELQTHLYTEEHKQYVFELLQNFKRPLENDKPTGLDLRDTVPPPTRLPPSISGYMVL